MGGAQSPIGHVLVIVPENEDYDVTFAARSPAA
jgi:hypothetical protein